MLQLWKKSWQNCMAENYCDNYFIKVWLILFVVVPSRTTGGWLKRRAILHWFYTKLYFFWLVGGWTYEPNRGSNFTWFFQNDMFGTLKWAEQTLHKVDCISVRDIKPRMSKWVNWPETMTSTWNIFTNYPVSIFSCFYYENRQMCAE